MDWILILSKTFWSGWAALGFAILFNVPPRTLAAIWIGGAMGGFIKFGLLGVDANAVSYTHLDVYKRQALIFCCRISFLDVMACVVK